MFSFSSAIACFRSVFAFGNVLLRLSNRIIRLSLCRWKCRLSAQQSPFPAQYLPLDMFSSAQQSPLSALSLPLEMSSFGSVFTRGRVPFRLSNRLCQLSPRPWQCSLSVQSLPGSAITSVGSVLVLGSVPLRSANASFGSLTWKCSRSG